VWIGIKIWSIKNGPGLKLERVQQLTGPEQWLKNVDRWAVEHAPGGGIILDPFGQVTYFLVYSVIDKFRTDLVIGHVCRLTLSQRRKQNSRTTTNLKTPSWRVTSRRLTTLKRSRLTMTSRRLKLAKNSLTDSNRMLICQLMMLTTAQVWVNMDALHSTQH